MAIDLTSQPSTFNEHPRPIARQGPFPWDKDKFFLKLGSYGDTGTTTAYGYAKNSPVAYVGQTLEVRDLDTGIVGFYQIQDTDGHLEQVGSRLLSAGETDDEDSKGWTGGKIKEWVAAYVEENGGGGTYIPSEISFAGISSINAEYGIEYSLTSFRFTVSNPANIKSNILFKCVDPDGTEYTYELLNGEIASTNTINISNFTNSSMRSLSISGQIENALSTYSFSAECEEKSGMLHANASYNIRGYYYAYIGCNASQTISADSIINLNPYLCNSTNFDIDITTTNGEYIWICVPRSHELTKVLMNGYNVTDTFETHKEIDKTDILSHTNNSRTSYSCHRSDEPQNAETITLSISISPVS